MTTLSNTVLLAMQLIALPSVTPEDHGAQVIIAERLEAIGFHITHLRFDNVDNLWAVHGDSGPIFCFAGHTDVVPSGPKAEWQTPPFEPTIADGMLYGRGAADMKGSLAAMITASERFVAQHPDHPGRLAFLITSDEEGPATHGTTKVVEWLNAKHEAITWCLVGEPSSTAHVGDVIKNGRRGSLNGKLTVKGIQGHIAYPYLADNPIHAIVPALTELSERSWDDGNDFFPPTSFQISNMSSGTGATNVIPGSAEVLFNFRFSTKSTAQDLQMQTEIILNKNNVNYDIQWKLSGEPFLTSQGELVDTTITAIQKITGIMPELSTAGGTSDGRFIAPTGAQVVELGPVNATIHQVDEHVKIEDLDQLSTMYEVILQQLLAP